MASTEVHAVRAQSPSGDTSTPKPLARGPRAVAGAMSLIARATSHPVMPGIARSVITRSNRSAPKRAIASRPLLATSTRCPIERSMS